MANYQSFDFDLNELSPAAAAWLAAQYSARSVALAGVDSAAKVAYLDGLSDAEVEALAAGCMAWRPRDLRSYFCFGASFHMCFPGAQGRDRFDTSWANFYVSEDEYHVDDRMCAVEDVTAFFQAFLAAVQPAGHVAFAYVEYTQEDGRVVEPGPGDPGAHGAVFITAALVERTTLAEWVKVRELMHASGLTFGHVSGRAKPGIPVSPPSGSPVELPGDLTYDL